MKKLSMHTLPRRTHGRVMLIVVVLVFALAAGLVASRWLMDRTLETDAAQRYPVARTIADFQLHTADGQPFTRADMEGRWNLLFFGFTNCPDVCPDTMAVLAQSMEQLRLMRREQLPQVIFVSVDPDRDQGELLADYVSWFDEDFAAVTGSDAQLQALARQLGIVYFHEAPDPDTGFYNVDHSASVLIVDPEARLYGRFPHPLIAEQVTADLFRFAL